MSGQPTAHAQNRVAFFRLFMTEAIQK